MQQLPAWIGLCAAMAAAMMTTTPAGAHPHVFIDGGVDFLFDGEGRLAKVRVTWDYDPMTSLFMLEDLGIDGTKPLSDDDRRRLAIFDTVWEEGYPGDTYLMDGKRAVTLSHPVSPEAEVHDGRVLLRFLRNVEPPFRPGADAVVEMYDPAFYYAYTVADEPRLEGTVPDGCRAEREPFRPSSQLVRLQKELSAIPADQTPDQVNVGALFTDKVLLSCK